MSLFPSDIDSNNNLLPKDGTVNYYGKILTSAEANRFYASLLSTIEWQHDEIILYGKRIVTKREVAWYGDEPYKYTYSNSTKYALPWAKELLELKTLVEKQTGEKFNSCLLNLYHNGDEGMAWHSDNEKELKKDGAIASLSFGAKRKFAFKHNDSPESISLILEHGSLLVMKDEIQSHWKHALPPSKKIKTPRINLTFRFIENANL